jgi:hypothetical protein
MRTKAGMKKKDSPLERMKKVNIGRWGTMRADSGFENTAPLMLQMEIVAVG